MHGGGCSCGEVRYEAADSPDFVCVCHCESCRRASGGAMVAWATFRQANFRITRGALRYQESSQGVRRGHCAGCGTSITYQNVTRPGEIDLTLASFDEPASFKPSAHIWTEDKLPWLTISDGLPQYARTVTFP